jgi:predicted membrane protein
MVITRVIGMKIPRWITILSLILPLLGTPLFAQQDQVTYVSGWDYVLANPLLTGLFVILVVLLAILIIIVIFRWYDKSFQHDQERQINQQLILDMQANRMEQMEFNRAMVRMLNATASIQEQVSATMSIVNSLLAGSGGVNIALKAKELAGNQEQNPTSTK